MAFPRFVPCVAGALQSGGGAGIRPVFRIRCKGFCGLMALFYSSRSRLAVAALSLLVAAVLFGGASRNEVPGWMLVTLVALGGIAWAVWITPPGALAVDRGAFWLMAACVAVPLVQLIPLPFSVWSNLPGRGGEVEAFRAAGLTGWLPISTMPGRTTLALFSLIAPICAFVMAALLDQRGRMALATALIGLACVSALLGLLQIAGGAESGLRLFAVTAKDAGVGLFANPNHQATLLMAAMPLVVAGFVDRLPRRGTVPPGLVGAAVAIILWLVVGMALTWSRAGLVFLAIGLIGGFFLLPDLMPKGRRGLVTQRRALVLSGVLVVGLATLVMLALGAGGVEEAARSQGGARIDNVPTFLGIAGNFLPFGSGLGSFDPVYRSYETLEMVNPFYLNQAHNEPAQLLIEAGVAGLALMLGLLAWWGRRAVAAWRVRDDGETVLLRRAAALASSFYLIHSLVDYPLRTPSGAVVFAMLCAMMLPPRARESRRG